MDNPISERMVEHYARTGLTAASNQFEEFGEIPNAVLLLNAEGKELFAPLIDREDRFLIEASAVVHGAVAAVMIGEAWYRELAEGEQRTHWDLSKDPEAGEEVFAIGMLAGSERTFRVSKKIVRQGGKAYLVDRRDEWTDEDVVSWLLDVLNLSAG